MTKFFIIFIFTFPSLIKTQIGICPIGFVWGGVCGFGTPCQPSLPPFHCLRGSCCRDQRPLSARLGPIIYPQDLIGINNGFGFSPGIGGIITGGVGGRFCFDTALNCFSFVAYCVVPIYRVCMITRCARTCGVCRGGFGGQSFGQSFGAAGITGGIPGGGIGGFGGISPGGIGSFGANGGMFPGGIGGLNGLNGLMGGIG